MKSDSPRKPLKAIMAAIFVAALLIFPFMLALYIGTAPFKDKIILTGLFGFTAAEKLWAMFFRVRQRQPLEAEHDWTAVAVGTAYIVLMYSALIECYFKRTGITIPALAWLGIGVYTAALILRYSAFACLKHQWAIHLDKILPDRSLVQSGPYRLMRHPLYLAYCLEALSIPLVLHAFWAFTFGLLVFVPLEIYRAYYEERFLRETFGAAYRDYVARVWAFFPLPCGKNIPDSKNQIANTSSLE
ncbi:MAG: isoprenylcysteine carboxylmethyltransferase family protein [Kiritimatiellae bacterium]|nr:isoprenylcysteine carboxylmethyltransferase family protein [Kiritimatiellia bacterium]